MPSLQFTHRRFGPLPASPGFTRRLLRLLAALCVACLGSASFAANIAIVLSRDAAAFRDAEKGFREALPADSLETLILADVTADVVKAKVQGGCKAFVAVGTDAATTLNTLLPPEALLFYCMVSDPLGAGLRSGRTTFGISTEVPIAAQFAFAASALPKAAKIGILYRSDSPKGLKALEAATQAAPPGWKIESADAAKYPSLSGAIDDLFAKKIDFVWTYTDSALFDANAIKAMLLASLRSKIPVFGFSGAFVRAGALMGVSLLPANQGRQAAAMVKRIGAAAAQPAQGVLDPPEFESAVNTTVAERLSVELPRAVVDTAKIVFKGD